MSKIDEKYIDALDQFTDALEQIVETLKSQQKAGKADTVNEFLKQPMDNLVTVVADLKKVTQKGFAELKSDNQEILKKIESIKQQKESGMFDRIEDPRNKNKIVDGIKVVILIAAGVLALGMAFKIIGKVDFLSVIALSGAIFIMATAYSKIADVKNISLGQVFKLSLILPMMALGLAASAYILKDFPTFSLKQGLSLLLIGGGLGLAAFLLLKSVGNIPIKSLLLVPLLPLILPIIAWSLVKASTILTGIQSLTFKQVIAVALVGLSIGVAMFAITFALKQMKNVSWKEIVALPIAITLISWSLVNASEILQGMKILNNPLGVIATSFVIGLSILAFVPAVKFLGKMALADITQGLIAVSLFPGIMVSASEKFRDFILLNNPLNVFISSFVMGLSILAFVPAVMLLGKMSLKDMFTGALAIPVITGAILAAAWIFQLLPGKMLYPSIEWTLGAGLSILLFGGMAVGLGLLIAGTLGVAAAGIAVALAAILAVAGTIVATSYILAEGVYNGNYPSLNWSLGVGASLLAFSLAAIAAAAAGIVGAVGTLFTGGEDPLLKIARSIVSISFEIQKGNYSGNYPSTEWASGVGLALIGFAAATILAAGSGFATKILSFFTGDEDPLMSLTKSIVNVSREIQKGNYDGNYPSIKWASGVGLALAEFAALKVLSAGADFASKILGFFSKGDPLVNLTKSIVNVSLEIQKGNYDGNYPSIEWATDVGLVLAEFAALKVIASGGDFASKLLTFFAKGDPLVSLAKSIVSVSQELNKVDWNNVKYPSKEYSDSVGQLLISMSNAYTTINNKGFFDSLLSIISKKQSLTGFAKEASSSIVEASKILANGNYNTQIKKDFVDNFVYFITNMSDMVDSADFDLDDISTFAAASMVLQPIISNWMKSLSQTDFTKYPTNEYTKNLISFLKNFDDLVSDWDSSFKDFVNFSIGVRNIALSIDMLSKVKPIPDGIGKSFIDFTNNLKALPEFTGLDTKAASINKLAMSFATLADSLSKVNSSLQNFGTLSKGLPLINVDDSKLLDTVDKYKGELKIVNDTQTSQATLLSNLKDFFASAPESKPKEAEKTKKQTENISEQQFYKDVSEIKSLLYEFKDFIEKPTQNGSFYK